MSKPKKAPRAEVPAGELWLVRACLAVALGISAFLAWTSFQGGGVPGCGPESGCDKVLNSRWGYVFGLPVSIFALPVYAALLAMVRPSGLPWRAAIPCAVLILFSALWFAGIQVFVLRAFCKYCMIAHAAGVVAALVLLQRNPLRLKLLLGPAGLSAAAAALLITAQLAAPARGPAQVPMGGGPVAPAAALEGPAPLFSIIEGQFTFDLRKVPVTGPLNAPKKVAKLFDYTCHHCRELHHLLGAFRQKHSNELAVVSLPMPLDSACNPGVRKTSPAHENACEYARLGLAVFHASPEKFEAFNEFVFTPPRPPDLAQTRAYAAQLAGRERLAAALQDPAVAEQIRTDINIYAASYRITKRGPLPQMFFEHGASIGAIQTARELEQVMAQNLGFPAPAP